MLSAFIASKMLAFRFRIFFKTMRSLKILLLCFCLVSSFGFAESKRQDNKIPIVETTVQNGFPNVFRPIGNLFKRLFGKKKGNFACELPPSVVAVDLNVSEITASCPLAQSTQNNSCQDNSQLIDVSIAAVANDKLVFVYQVSGGQIVGKGANVMWNLSGVKVGTNTITVGIDSGDGVIGRTVTKIVKVIECPDCQVD